MRPCKLPHSFLARPIAHRALHDSNVERVENGMAAIDAAIDGGFGIEIDVQPSRDGHAMVFHDYDLGRLTTTQGPIAQRTAKELSELTYVTGETGIPTLPEVLSHVAGRAPLLIEIKDQDGMMGPNVGPLERTVAQALAGYTGDVAVMSFNPNTVVQMAELTPDVPRGLTTCDYRAKDWKLLTEATRAHLRSIPDFERTGACFISHRAGALTDQPVQALKKRGVPILCWTVTSAEKEAKARKVADNITFERYIPA
ncbi:glycerophosphodiester phosphodiesterase family protein [Celeribacter sp.]|uniref:glycerophosphodiester phosphodiesterase family protein n=1 Tax=Celeribacter sp. TaxID=1890673 RepID=UPI003A9013AE